MRQISFSGYEWQIKDAISEKVGPGPNYFSSEEDAVSLHDGSLYLRTILKNERWYSSEVVLEHPLGYGTYTFTLKGRVDTLDPRTVFGAFLYADDENEIDIEFGAALAGAGKGQYVIQPTQDNRLARFALPEDVLTSHSITWTKEMVEFKSWIGGVNDFQPESLIYAWEYEGEAIKDPDKVRMIFNLWLYEGKEPLRSEEVCIIHFDFAGTEGNVLR